MRKVLQINTEGQAKWLDLDAEGTTSLDVLQGGVEGMIEPIGLAPTLEMYVNEEYLYAGFGINPYATRLVARAYAPRQTVDILGPVVLTGGVDEEGETSALDEDLARRLVWSLGLTLDTAE